MSPVADYVFDGTLWQSTAGLTSVPITPDTTEVAGAAPLGSTSYTIPGTGVWYVATTGSDSNAGTLAAPKATIGAAVAAAAAGDTIVVRAGTYNQKVTGNVTKALTIQAYPGEVVWFDGTAVVTGFVQSGTTWVKSGWTYHFDHSASYTYGSDLGGFVGSQNPMAAWPDLVFIDGQRKWLVSGTPGPGQYAVDYTNDLLILGDDPTGREVRATTLDTFMVVAAPVTMLGFGIRRYATPLPAMGMVNVVSAGGGSYFENMFFQDVATQLVSLSSTGSRTTATKCTFTGGGAVCVHANNTSGATFTVSNCVMNDINWRLWNIQPASAAIRVSRCLYAIVTNNVITNSQSAGIWFDVYSRHTTITNNYIDTVVDMGICYEISQWALIAGNTVINQQKEAILVLASADVRVWNNLVDRATQFDVAFKDDSRSNSEFGVVVYVYRGECFNNVFTNANAEGTTGWRLAVYDSALVRSADDFMIAGGITGNLYTSDQAPTSATSCSRLGGWGVGGGSSTVSQYSTPSAFQAAHPTYVGTNAMTALAYPSRTDLQQLGPSLAAAIPDDVAAALAQPVGARVLGPGRPAPIAA